MTHKLTYCAVIETGSYQIVNGEEIRETTRRCGHNHRSIEEAVECGKRLEDRRKEPYSNTFVANVAWYGFRIHDQYGRRVNIDE